MGSFIKSPYTFVNFVIVPLKFPVVNGRKPKKLFVYAAGGAFPGSKNPY
jgi:hypothetical protein